MADPGEGPGGPGPPLFLDQNEARRAEKIFLRPPPLFQGLDDRLPPYIESSGSANATILSENLVHVRFSGQKD